jgi:diguanylate cyclase (GGDEF)-like protein/PAS domain S-box-containing protein
MTERQVMSAPARRRESGRALGCLFIGGGALGIMVDVLVPPPPGTSLAGILVPCLVALVAGVTLLRLAGRLSRWQIMLALAFGSTLISVGLYYGSDVRSGAQILYLWVITYAFFTLPMRAALLETAFVAASYGMVLILRDEATGAARWTITTATLVVAGLFVARVVRQLDVLIDRGREREAALADAEARFRSAFENAAIGMAIVDLDGRWLRVNDALAGMTRYPAAELVGILGRDLVIREEGAEAPPVMDQLVAGELSVYHSETRYRRGDGTAGWVALSASTVRDGDGAINHVIAQMQDISDRKEAEQELERQALHDPLTGLPNRRLFADRVEMALGRAQRRADPIAVCFVDLDAFKLVNDSLGHEVGDQLLVAVAERLRAQLRPADTIARFGGDEFTIVCEDTDEAGAGHVAERILESFARPFAIGERELFVTASIGIAIHREGGTSADEMLRDADAAMYRAKDQGRSRHAIFDGTMHRRASARLELENDLRRALEQEEFELAYQPDVHLATGRVTGVEALIRWRHPRRGLLLPGDFIPVAEESGLIVPLGLWVVWEACRQARRWQEAGHALAVAINISPRQLADPRLHGAVEAALETTGAQPDLLTLEITETAAAHAHAAELDALRALGVRLAIDDFGSGFSSLNQVRSLPTVDTLKIDRTFIQELGWRAADDAIISAIVSIADALDMETVAEGIENELQARLAKRLGCSRGQGYHFGRPMAPEQLEEMFARAPLAI